MAKKANGDKKPKAEKKSKKTPRKKLTAAELSDTERQRLLLAHKRKLKPLLLAEAAAKKAVTGAYELAKKDGITKKMLEVAFLLDSDEGTEKVKAVMQMYVDVDRWTGSELGEQLDMFAKQSVADKAFADGKRAALNDEPAKPPTNLSQAATQQWLAGHSEGREANNTARAAGFKPLGETVKTIVPPPLGDKPATHAAAH